MREISTMTAAEKLLEIESLGIQLGILNDQHARIAELKGLIRAGESARKRLETMGRLGRSRLLAMLDTKLEEHRTELAELEALFVVSEAAEASPAKDRREATPEELSHAAQLGRDGFAAGLSAAPAASKSLMDFIAALKVQSTVWIQLMDAYAAAWTKANLDAPVPGWSAEENADFQRLRASK